MWLNSWFACAFLKYFSSNIKYAQELVQNTDSCIPVPGNQNQWSQMRLGICILNKHPGVSDAGGLEK